MRTIQEIIQATPRASFANPHIQEDAHDPRKCLVRAASPADACRYIAALRGEGYAARLASCHDARLIQAAPASADYLLN